MRRAQKANPIEMIYKKQEDIMLSRMVNADAIQKVMKLYNNKKKDGIKLVNKTKKK